MSAERLTTGPVAMPESLKSRANTVTSSGTGNTGSSAVAAPSYMHLFDTRLYRILGMYSNDGIATSFGKGEQITSNRKINESGSDETFFYPHYSYGSYVSDYYESVKAVQTEKEEFISTYAGSKSSTEFKTTVDNYDNRIKFLQQFKQENKDSMLAPHSFIHPYAIVKLAGASGNVNTVKQLFTYDSADQRRWYETEGSSKGGYAHNPTTTTLIKWGNDDPRGKTPYSFQDFVFCKDWNIIPNNRLITLRRYAAPVSDAITFSDYNTKSQNGSLSVLPQSSPWTPLATAVTYFGEGTGNTLSELLSFSAKYNWEEIHSEDTPIDITSAQSEKGADLTNHSLSGIISSGMAAMSQFLGFADTFRAENGENVQGIDPQLAASTLPPDPYKNGPYMNRIMGPINVIMDTYKRKRGLKFEHSIKVKFNYVARPIAGINNKAVLLDLLSNMMILCYSSGTWFGGMWRYAPEGHPAIYPFKYGDAMNKLYRGELFGKDGAVKTLINHAYSDGKSFIGTFFSQAFDAVKNIAKGVGDLVMGAVTGNKDRVENGKDTMAAVEKTPVVQSIEKVLAAKVIKAAQIPYINQQRALLTGLPVGDWHLTIGNPLNPIAMIGNLVVKNIAVKFSDELGPDDFPIGFEATVELAHGLGRDRDAIESMFNRGYGRIYSLPLNFKSSADGETEVDENTGSSEPRTKYEETRNTFFGRGFRFIAKTEASELSNKGEKFYGVEANYSSLVSPNIGAKALRSTSMYMINPWQMTWNM